MRNRAGEIPHRARRVRLERDTRDPPPRYPPALPPTTAAARNRAVVVASAAMSRDAVDETTPRHPATGNPGCAPPYQGEAVMKTKPMFDNEEKLILETMFAERGEFVQWIERESQADRVKMRCSAATSVLQVTEDHERHR